MTLGPVSIAPAQAERLARLARTCFPDRHAQWSADDFVGFTASSSSVVFADPDLAQCYLVMRVVAGEAELLDVAVAPDMRRKGLARTLMAAAETHARTAGCARIVLEVAEDNTGAQAFYDHAGYARIGTRSGYYLRPDGSRTDALVLHKDLSSA